MHLGGGFTFINNTRILENSDPKAEPYLKLGIDEFGLIRIDARFEDANGNMFMVFSDSMMRVNTVDALDIISTRRGLKFIHRTKEIELNISQRKNGDLEITGKVYLNGGLYRITKQKVYEVEHDNTYSNNTKLFEGDHLGDGPGLVLAPGHFKM